MKRTYSLILIVFICLGTLTSIVCAAVPPLSFVINLSKNVIVDTTGGTPTISINVGGVSRTASYVSGSGTNALTFTYTPVVSDIDLDGITVTSPLTLNGGTIRDTSGNDATLTFSAPNTSSVHINYPSLSMDFINGVGGRYTLNGTSYSTLSNFLTSVGGTFSRPSNATYFDSTGAMQVAATGVPRFDHDPITHATKGILIEDSKTNYVQNSQMVGTVLGIIGSGGSLPTSWGSQLGVIGGTGTITANILATGALNGLNYIDINYSGTINSGTGVLDVTLGPSVPATPGTVWTISAYSAIIGGTVSPNITAICPKAKYGDAGGSYNGESPNCLTSSATFGRNARTVTAPANTTSFTARYAMYITAGAYNITIRYGAPQVELGSIVTSYIPTPVGATATRSADILTIPTGGWYNAAQGSLMAQSVIPVLGGGKYPGAASLDDGTANNAIHMLISDQSGGQIASSIYNGNVLEFLEYAVNYIAGSTLKQATYYDTNAARHSYNGVLGTVDTSVTVPSVNILRVGARRGGVDKLNGWVQKIKYYPSRMSDAQLQLLTQ